MGITAMENMLAKFESTLPTAANVAYAQTVQTQSELVRRTTKRCRPGTK